MSRYRKGFLVLMSLIVAATAWMATASAQSLPSYYPPEYQEIIEASKSEGTLLIYSNMAEYNWRPVIEGFQKLYPWIRVQTLDLNSSEVFERYYAETATGSQTGDLLVTGAVDAWQRFIERGEAVDYVSPEAPYVPDWSRPLPGLYTVTTDPLIIVYNKLLIPDPNLYPRGVEHLSQLVQSHPNIFRGKITTYDATSGSFGFSAYWAFVRDRKEKAWDWFDIIGPHSRPERSAGPMVEKITTGEYVAGWFVSGITYFPRAEERAAILGWNWIEDGTPLFLRGMAVPKASGNPNSAKLMLDFILSEAGQIAFGKGGMTPYRPGVAPGDGVLFTYESILNELGAENVIHIDYDPEMLTGFEAFLERWEQAFGLGQ